MNTPNRKQQARRVFLTLVDLTESAQHIALEQACGDDAALRAEVEELLLADREAKGFLSLPSGLQPVSDSVEQPGSQIGHYKLLEQIGEGGMGTVWMAEQKEPVKRRVALKIIKLGMDTKQVVARFEAERQALAMMDHPHIAKVLDAGSTDTGRPYFVMEYIKGIPILEYCDHEKVDTKTRLELFTSVCHAIQHAHQKGIIHRDIKPSNVLVTMHDGVPVTKVIDFGIAKATNSELTTRTLFTEHRQMVGTPAYMSPEQAEMSGLDIDTRSDIYSLGVLLYELLTGTTPFDMKDLLSKGFAEMMRTIREEEPHKPSTRVSTLGDTGTRTAQQRRVDVHKLGTLLRGDLDWIVMKCLEKDRTRRYETANGLAADIQRHLRDEPVTAAAPGVGYKLSKFVKRNRGQVIAASVLVVALLTGIVGTSWGLVQSSRIRTGELQRQVEDQQRTARDNARRDRNAEAVTALLAQCEEALRAGDSAKAGIALEAGRKRAAEGGAEKEAERLARLSADLTLLVALDSINSRRWTWIVNDFLSTREVAAKMREPLKKFGADPEVVSVESAAAVVNASAVRNRIVAALDWQLWSRHSAELRALLRRLDHDPYRNEIRDTLLTQDTATFVELMKRPEVLEQPAEFAAFLGEFNQVTQSRRLELLKAAVLRRPRDMSVLMALARNSSSNTHDALRWYQAALAADPANPAVYNNIGVGMRIISRPEDALAFYHKAIELDPTRGFPYLNLGNALSELGRLEDALANHRKAVELDPESLEAYCTLGNTLSRRGEFEEALVNIKKALEFDPKHAEAHYSLGVIFQEQGKLAEAIASFDRVIEIEPKSFSSYLNIGTALRNQGRFVDAIGYFEKCIELDPKSAPAQTNLSGVLSNLARYDESIAMSKKAIESDSKYAMAYHNLGTTYLVTGAFDDAVSTLRKAVELDPNYAEAHCNLAQALKNQGKHEEALAEFKLCHLLGSKQPAWKYPSADWIRDTEAEIAKTGRLESKLTALLKGEYQPIDNAERKEFAFLCQNKKLNYAATRLFAEVMETDPNIGDRVDSFVRYNAACVAVLSAGGQGEDTSSLDEPERVRLRKQALDWLRADLSIAAKKIESGKTPMDSWALWFCSYSKTNVDLVHIRDTAALANLPAGEQQAFTQFWADLAAVLKKAQHPPAEAKPVKTPGAESQIGKTEQALVDLNNQGITLLGQGKFAEAEALLVDAVDRSERAFAGAHPITAMLLHHHADALRFLGRLDEALPEARRAVDMYRDHTNWPTSEGTHAATVLWLILTAQGRAEEALAVRRETLYLHRRTLPPVSRELSGHLASIGLDLVKLDTLEAAREAEPLLRECLEIRLKIIPDDWRVPNTRSLLGGALLIQKKYAEAEPLLIEGYQGLKQREAEITPEGKARLPESLERLVRFYEATGDQKKAAEWKAKR